MCLVGRYALLSQPTYKWINESAVILSAFENRLRASLVKHTMQTNPAVEQNKNIKWSESPSVQ